jgi:hypothetical protein
MTVIPSEAQRSEAPSRRGLGKSASGCGLGPRCEKITTGAQSPVLYSTGQRHTASHFFSDSVPCLRQGFGRRARCLCGLTGGRSHIRKVPEIGFVLSDFGTLPCVFNNLLASFSKKTYVGCPDLEYLQSSIFNLQSLILKSRIRNSPGRRSPELGFRERQPFARRLRLFLVMDQRWPEQRGGAAVDNGPLRGERVRRSRG